MRWFIDSQGNPYCGDRQGNDQSIPARPDDGKQYKWQDGWVEDVSAENETVKSTIVALENKTLRAIREQLINVAIAVPDIDACSTIADLKTWLKTNLALESWRDEKGDVITIQDIDSKIKAERGKLK